MSEAPGASNHEAQRLYEAARLYYDDGASQAEIARLLDVSRPTISRMISQARDEGIVQIRVINPLGSVNSALEDRLTHALGISEAYIAPGLQTASSQGLTQVTRRAIEKMGLGAGDVLAISSGQAMHAAAHHAMPPLPGVKIVPCVGGVSEPEPWHQTNEIARLAAASAGAEPQFLFAQAMPSKTMRKALEEDENFRSVTALWKEARGALVGIGAPTASRSSLSTAIPQDHEALQNAAGDVCLHFFDIAGKQLSFPGAERMVAIAVDILRGIPQSTAVAVGAHKAVSITAAARLGVFRRLVTDEVTARAVLALAGQTDS